MYVEQGTSKHPYISDPRFNSRPASDPWFDVPIMVVDERVGRAFQSDVVATSF
jgi:hypothetical protein